MSLREGIVGSGQGSDEHGAPRKAAKDPSGPARRDRPAPVPGLCGENKVCSIHMRSGWFDCTEPSLRTYSQGERGCTLVRSGSTASNLLEPS